MSINELCGIAVTVTLIMAVGMFVALVSKLNHGLKRNSRKRAEEAVLR